MSATNPNDQYEFFKYIKLTADGRLLVESSGVVNDTYVQAGSVDVPNSELVLLRTDGVEVRIDAAEFLSDAFVTGGVYDPLTSTITFTNNLGGTFVVSGFQLSTTASNGLTEVGNDVRLGGQLTEDTTITGDALNDFNLTYNGNFKVDSSLFGYINTLEMNGGVFQILQDGDGEGTIDFYLGAEDGLYLNRTRGTSIFNLDVPADNSLSIDSTRTTISSPDQGIRLYGRQVGTNPSDKSELSLGESGYIGLLSRNSTLGDSAISIVENGVTRPNSFINFDSPEFYFKSNVIDVTQRGAKYGSPTAGIGEDYSVNWNNTTPDSILTTKGYVDRLVTSGVTASNGLTEVAGDIQLGGTLTQDTNIDGNNNSLTLSNNSFLLLDSNDNLLIRANNSGNGGSIELIAENSEISAEARDIDLVADTARLGGSVNIQLDSIGNTATLGNNGNTLVYFMSDKHQFIDSLNISQNKGIYYPTDYTINWDETTPDEIIPTKGYVDRKSLYNITLGRNGNLNSNAYVRGGGNVIHNATRGELITMKSKLEKLTYRVNDTNSTGGFETYNLVIRHMGNTGILLNETVLTLAPVGFAQELNLTPALLGWDGEVEALHMVTIQFRQQAGSSITVLNNVQTTLQMSIQ